MEWCFFFFFTKQNQYTIVLAAFDNNKSSRNCELFAANFPSGNEQSLLLTREFCTCLLVSFSLFLVVHVVTSFLFVVLFIYFDVRLPFLFVSLFFIIIFFFSMCLLMPCLSFFLICPSACLFSCHPAKRKPLRCADYICII